MRTTVSIDNSMLDAIMAESKEKNRSRAVKKALSDWLRQQEINKIKDLKGKLHFEYNIEDIRNAELEFMKKNDS